MTAGLMMAMTAPARLIAAMAQIVIMTPRLIIALMSLVDVLQLFMVLSFPDRVRWNQVRLCRRCSWGVGQLSCSLNRLSYQWRRSIFRHRSAVNGCRVNCEIDDA